MKGRPWVNQAKSEASKMREEALWGSQGRKAGKIREKLAEGRRRLSGKGGSLRPREDIASLKWNAGKKTEEVINKVISELILTAQMTEC